MVSRLRGNDNGAISVKWGSSDSRRRDNLTLCLPRYDFVIDHSCLQLSCDGSDRDVETAGVSTYFSWFFRQLTYHHIPPPPTHCLYERGMDRTTCRNRRGFDLLFVVLQSIKISSQTASAHALFIRTGDGQNDVSKPQGFRPTIRASVGRHRKLVLLRINGFPPARE
jgi:hypothetical protein